MNHRRNSAPDEHFDALPDHFAATYETGQLRPRAHGAPADGLRPNCRRIALILPPRRWKSATNKERWNKTFQALDGHGHPTEWKLVDCTQTEI